MDDATHRLTCPCGWTQDVRRKDVDKRSEEHAFGADDCPRAPQDVASSPLTK